MDWSYVLIEAVPHQIKTLKMQYVTVEPNRLPTTNIFIQSLNFQMNTTITQGGLTDSDSQQTSIRR